MTFQRKGVTYFEKAIDQGCTKGFLSPLCKGCVCPVGALAMCISMPRTCLDKPVVYGSVTEEALKNSLIVSAHRPGLAECDLEARHTMLSEFLQFVGYYAIDCNGVYLGGAERAIIAIPKDEVALQDTSVIDAVLRTYQQDCVLRIVDGKGTLVYRVSEIELGEMAAVTTRPHAAAYTQVSDSEYIVAVSDITL